MVKYFVLSFVVLITASCSNTSSDNVKTTGFYATYSVQGDNVGAVTCTAKFQVGGATGTYLSLDGTDTVTCNGLSMAKSEFFGVISYSVTSGIPYSIGGTYTIALTRAAEGTYTSSVILPAAIAGIAPTAGSNHTKGTLLNTSWGPSPDGSESMWATLSISGVGTSRSTSLNDVAPENGLISFEADRTVLDPPQSGTQSATLSFERYRYGSMASGLSGTISGSQLTSVSINLVP